MDNFTTTTLIADNIPTNNVNTIAYINDTLIAHCDRTSNNTLTLPFTFVLAKIPSPNSS